MAPEVFQEGGLGHDTKADSTWPPLILYISATMYYSSPLFVGLQSYSMLIVWSFGMVLYELITLKQPYHDKNHFEISDCNVKGIRPSITDNVDRTTYRDLIKLFESCTNKKPQDRPNAAEILTTLATL